MSRYFVTDPPVAVPEFDTRVVISDTPPNVIYIKAKMDVDTDARVKAELVKIGSDDKTLERHIGLYQLALLIHNIVKWEGPGFVDDQGHPIPCDAAHIRTLDPTVPHIGLVLDEITRRNQRTEAPNPKSPAEPGSAINGSHDGSPANAGGLSLQLATGMSMSSSRGALAGHLRRSGNSTPTTSPNSLDD